MRKRAESPAAGGAPLAGPVGGADPLVWPRITRACRPWTRWWWLGSAVDGENLTALLQQYWKAGLGGVEICPIYGAKGFDTERTPLKRALTKRAGLAHDPLNEAEWPGWQFYAAVNFGPEGGLWHGLPALNAYFARCQSILQAGRPANDVLLYLTVYDLWQSADGLMMPFAMPGKWLWPTPFFAAAMTLWQRGYGFDAVSDRLLRSAVQLDPRYWDRTGVAELRDGPGGAAQVYLQLVPGESLVLRTYGERVVEGRPWAYFETAGPAEAVDSVWRVRFTEGGPVMPASFETRELASWTALGDAEARRFAGTARYTLELDGPDGPVDDWLLDLGRVCESARVRLNGRAARTVWCAPFRIPVGGFLRAGRNRLQVDVTNLAANRIADLDRRGVDWKRFHEINFVNREYRPFDASEWPLRDSGLLGPVRLIPVRRMRFS